MKRFYLLLLTMYVSFFGYSFANIKQASNVDDPATKTVIIRLKDHFNSSDYSKRNLAGLKAVERRGMLINKMKSFSSQSQEKILESSIGLKNIKQFWIANIISAEATDEMIEQLRKRDDVESVTLDNKQATFDAENGKTIQPAEAGTTAYNVELVRALKANSYGYTGAGVIVGIVDSGLNTEHEDLKNSLWEDPKYPNHGWNTALNNDDIHDISGHGTHCAGTIIGNGAAGTRTGIAPGAKLMIVKPWDNNGNCTETYTLDAIQFAIDHGANLISMSQGFNNASYSNEEKKTWRDAMNNLLNCNVLMVNAAGNEGKVQSGYPIPNNIRMPGCCPAPWLNPGQTVQEGVSGVYTVGNLCKEGDKRWESSSVGPVTWKGVPTYDDYYFKPGMGLIKPDIGAPGEKVLSLDWENTKGYKELTGTSMATPCVAGIAALILSKNPEMTPADIARIISESAVKISPTFNNETGAGRADAFFATFYTPNVDMNCTEVSIKETSGSKNGHLNINDEANLSLSFKNETSAAISDYQLEIKCLYPHATFNVKEGTLPELKAEGITEFADYCNIKVLPEAQTGDLIDITIIVRKGDKVWTNLLRLPVCKAELSNEDMQAKEVGNQNGIIEAGEKAELTFPISSTGTEPCRNVTAKLTSSSPYLSFGEDIKFQEISGKENAKFNCNISKETAKWHMAELNLKLSGENIDTTFTYKFIIGKQAALIVDRSKNNKSANAVDTYLAKTNYTYAKTKTLPTNADSLQIFHSVWFFDGVYPNANTISEKETQVLTDYIKAGGYLYMEGGDLWMKNKSGMNEYLNINPIGNDGGRLGNIIGCVADFNTGVAEKYTYSGLSIDNISPIEPAFAMYKNNDPEFITTVAYNQGSYRAIGSSFEVGGTFTDTGENKVLESYLDFFLIKDGHFTSGITNAKQAEKLLVNGFKSGNDYVLNISMPGSSSAVINVYSVNGQLLRQISQNINENATILIPNNSYKGINYITIRTPEETITKKVVF